MTDKNPPSLKELYEKKRSEKQRIMSEAEETEARKNALIILEKLEDVKNISSNDTAWRNDGNNYKVVMRPNTERLPSGLYDIVQSMDEGIFLLKRNISMDELFILPTDIYSEVVDEFKKFWESKAKFKEYKMVHKRGVLMFGAPGNGKTSVINILIKQVSDEFDGICINVENINSFKHMVSSIRHLSGDRPILAIIEDFDSFLYQNNTKDVLNILDGNVQIDNVIYLATTNYIDKIEPRFRARPSRFDLVVEIPLPDEKVREFYLREKIHATDLENINIKEWIKDSEGFSFAALKEMIISIIILKKDYNESIMRLRDMMDSSNGIRR